MQSYQATSAQVIDCIQTLAINSIGPIQQTEYGGRIAIWNLQGNRYAIELPFEFIIARNPRFQNKLLVHLNHSGYTANDEDGKIALLSMDVALHNSPLSSQEKQDLKNNGIDIGAFSIQNGPQDWKLDVSLQSNPQEESRIKNNIGLRIGWIPNVNRKVEVRWMKQKGAVLYEWLTNKADGLKFNLTCRLEVRGIVSRKLQINLNNFDKWSKLYSNLDGTIDLDCGEDALLSSLLSENVIEDISFINPNPLNPLTIGSDFLVINQKIKSASTVVGNSRRIALTAIKNLDLSSTANIALVSSILVRFTVSPGLELLNYPELVTDLTSGSVKGIEALKIDKE